MSSGVQRHAYNMTNAVVHASRIKNMLGLALDCYSIEQTLGSGGATPASRARCKIELDRIEKQFDDCVAFLIRILSFKLNVWAVPTFGGFGYSNQLQLYFYMSNSGNLQTVPRFDSSAARAGRATASKAE